MKNERNSTAQFGLHQGPAPATSEGAPRSLTSAQSLVLQALVSHGGPAKIAELSAITKLHGNTVREHLNALAKTGLVRHRVEAPLGRGRPSSLFEAVRAHQPTTELAVALAAELSDAASDPAAAAVRAGRVWAAMDRSDGRVGDTSRPALEQVLQRLTEHGFAPLPQKATQDASSGKVDIHLRECPMLAAAREQPEVVCNVHLGLVRGWLEDHAGTAADLEPFAGSGYCTVMLTDTLDSSGRADNS